MTGLSWALQRVLLLTARSSAFCVLDLNLRQHIRDRMLLDAVIN